MDRPDLSRAGRLVQISLQLNKMQANKAKQAQVEESLKRRPKPKLDADFEYAERAPQKARSVLKNKSDNPVVSLPAISRVSPQSKVRRWMDNSGLSLHPETGPLPSTISVDDVCPSLVPQSAKSGVVRSLTGDVDLIPSSDSAGEPITASLSCIGK